MRIDRIAGRAAGLLVTVSIVAVACAGEERRPSSAPVGSQNGDPAAVGDLPYYRSDDFKFPPIRGSETLVTGPLNIDELLDLAPVARNPFWSPATSRITFARGGGLHSVDREGRSLDVLEIGLGESGFFLTPQQPAYSPDGAWLAYISNKSGTPELWLWASVDGTDVQLTDLGFEEINAYSWAPDSRWIAFSGNRHGSFDIWKVSVPGGHVQRLTADHRYEVNPTWTSDGRSIVYVRLDERWVDHTVIRISADGVDSRVIAENTDFFDYGYGRTFGYPLVSPGGNHIAFRSHRSGWINYWIVSPDGGAPRPIYPQARDQNHGEWSPDGRWFAFTSNENGTHDLRIVSADGAESRVLVAPEMGIASSPRWAPDGREIVYTLETPTRPAELHVVSVEEAQSRRLLGASIDAAQEANLAVPEKVYYPSTDGLVIPAYLYRPAGTPAGARLPGVLWIHGGPTSQWHDSFHNHVQFIVQEGYVVLMPNIRGSSGYGKAFEKLNERCWGHCDLKDVVAGVEYLESLPYVDPDNMGIYGASYGGIMSMAAAAFAPGVFQAAIPHGGYADWIEFYHGDNELRHIKLLEHDLGPFDEYEHVWRRSSSIYAVPNITTPMLLVHGVGRYPVYRQTYDFARALQRHQKPFRYNVYPGENYYVSGRQNRRQLWLDMLMFLNQQLKDDVVRAPDPEFGERPAESR